jgi:hypothetical protein
MHSFTLSPTHSLIPSLSLSWSLLHSLAQLFTQALNNSFTYSPIHSLRYVIIHSFIHLIIHSFTPLLVHSLTNSITCSFTLIHFILFVPSIPCSFILLPTVHSPLTHPLIRSFNIYSCLHLSQPIQSVAFKKKSDGIMLKTEASQVLTIPSFSLTRHR